MSCPRVLVFIPAYNASTTIQWVLERIPDELSRLFEVHVLVIDDASSDDTATNAQAYLENSDRPFGYTVLANPKNRGYGGNQKLGYMYAVENGFDCTVMVHGDGQYPPEAIEQIVERLVDTGAGAVFGSRFLRPGGARKGGMPLYKRVANRALTWTQNRVLGTTLSEFHSGFRAYSVKALAHLPIHLNSDDFHFDTEIFIQFVRSGYGIAEIDIPTYYGDEVCHVNGVKYGFNVLGQSARAFAHDKGLFYESKYDVAEKDSSIARYQTKLDFTSPTTLAAARIEPGERVLDVGSGSGGVVDLLTNREGCTIFGVDLEKPPNIDQYERFWTHNLNSSGAFPRELPPVDSIVILDVIEHLSDPEGFVRSLASYCERVGTVSRILVSTANIAFVIIRLALLFGQFNYGTRGILDRTHTRLFTYSSFSRLFQQAGFELRFSRGVPAPFPLAMKNRGVADFMLVLNKAMIRIHRRLFSYQIFLELRPPVGQSKLLQASRDASGGLREHV